jgi:antirestriction protein ArdC
MPWTTSGTMPHNAITKKPYRGINLFLLFAPASGNGWLTFKQAQEVGANVKKGEHGQKIVFFSPFVVTDEKSGKEKSIPLLKQYTVFHTSQIENLPAQYLDTVKPMLPECERIAQAELLLSQANLNYGSDKAFYRSVTDSIHLPNIGAFKKVDDFYSTALHELTHWTGHEKRCNREFGKRFGDSAYAREELVAELGSAFLMAGLGLNGINQHAAYLNSWIKILKEDKKAIFVAASAAQKATDFILSANHVESEELMAV